MSADEREGLTSTMKVAAVGLTFSSWLLMSMLGEGAATGEEAAAAAAAAAAGEVPPGIAARVCVRFRRAAS